MMRPWNSLAQCMRFSVKHYATMGLLEFTFKTHSFLKALIMGRNVKMLESFYTKVNRGVSMIL